MSQTNGNPNTPLRDACWWQKVMFTLAVTTAGAMIVFWADVRSHINNDYVHVDGVELAGEQASNSADAKRLESRILRVEANYQDLRDEMRRRDGEIAGELKKLYDKVTEEIQDLDSDAAGARAELSRSNELQRDLIERVEKLIREGRSDGS